MLLGALVCPLTARAVEQKAVPEMIEVYWQDSLTVPAPGVSQIVVVDESICRAEVSGDNVRVFGLARGDTAAFAWVGGQRIAFRINVVQPPATPPAPQLSEAALQHMGYGTIGSLTQYFNDSVGRSRVLLQQQFSWDQNNGPAHLSVRAQANSTLDESAAPGFNLTSGSIQYRRPGLEINLLDFALHLNGAGHDYIPQLTNWNTVVLRGAGVTIQSGANTYGMFAGATPSYYYLTLAGTKQLAGFTFSHTQSDKLELYSTIALVNAPPVSQLLTGGRQISAFDTTGIRFRPSQHLLVQASGGPSTEGAMAQGAVIYGSNGLSAFIAASTNPLEFPLNRLQMFLTTKASVLSGARYRFTSRMDGGFFYQHNSGSSVLGQPTAASSDFINPSLNFLLTPRESLTLNYTYSETKGIASASQHGSRIGVALNSQLTGNASYTVQVDLGKLLDPFQLRTASDLSFRDSFNLTLKGQAVWFNFLHQRVSKSIAGRLNDQLDLLSQPLQKLFLQNPLAFVSSTNLPPDVLESLRGLQPTDTEASVSLQLHLPHKVEFSPNFSYQHNAFSRRQQSSNTNFGYALLYEPIPSLQLQSSLSNVFLYNSAQNRFQRTTVFTIGAQKTFQRSQFTVLPARRWHTIRGRVYRDLNGRVAETDGQGRYEFQRVSSGRHTVQLPLGQFTHPVRVTTATNVDVELIERRTVEIDFGIVDFARLMGTVYNDYAMNGSRRMDAPGLRGVQLVLQGGTLRRTATADSAGEFEFEDLPAGEYILTVDSATVPPNFSVPPDSMHLQVGPTTTVVCDVPLRALRSISGHVYLKTDTRSIQTSPEKTVQFKPAKQARMRREPAEITSAAFVLKPIAGIRIMAGESVAITDRDGSFTLRQLPAGDVEVGIVPASNLPTGMNTPSGRVQMPRDPLSVEGASIVITNPKLLKYLVEEPIQESSEARP
jgi:SdrD B-like domain